MVRVSILILHAKKAASAVGSCSKRRRRQKSLGTVAAQRFEEVGKYEVSTESGELGKRPKVEERGGGMDGGNGTRNASS